MYYFREHNLYFLAQPRTASRAVAKVMMDLGAKQSADHHGIGKIPDGAFVMSTVRNHWDALVSWYTILQEARNLSLYQWITTHVVTGRTDAARHFIPHKLYWRYLPYTTYVLRYESLNDDLCWCLQRHGLTFGTTQVISDSGSNRAGRQYALFYDSRSIHAVYDYYGDEIERLGYSFDTLTQVDCARRNNWGDNPMCDEARTPHRL